MTTLPDEKPKELKSKVKGHIVLPGDPNYDNARTAYNAMHDRKPGAIIHCIDGADVIAAVTAGRNGGLDLPIIW